MASSVHTNQADPLFQTAHELCRGMRARIAGIARTLHRNRLRRATLRELHALNDWALRDIGIHRGEICEHVDRLLAACEVREK